jgi:CDP-2,3-bis-(O-geranylgeranyl)-sn-glycerol synthase
VVLVVEFLLLLLLANGTPVLARRLLKQRFAWPLDGGLRLPDDQPLFGTSKTLRGVVLSVVVTSLGAAGLGLGWQLGAVTAALAMTGDLCSSFIKRRMKLPSSSNAPMLDQVPESLFPALACQSQLGFSVAEILLIVTVFLIGNLLANRLGV